MSAFGTNGRTRVTQTPHDESLGLGIENLNQDLRSQHEIPIKFGRSKPAKSSSLRKIINFNDEPDEVGMAGADATARSSATRKEMDEPYGPIVIRPSTTGRKGSCNPKIRPPSRPSVKAGDNAATDVNAVAIIVPKALGQRAPENNALRRSTSSAQDLLQSARFARNTNEDARPRYSKAYLKELETTTPNTPQNMADLRILDDEHEDDEDTDARENERLTEGEAMDVDFTKLEGAMVVSGQDLVARRSPKLAPVRILSDAGIRERKERRARLALESYVVSLDVSDEDDSNDGEVRSIAFQTSKAKTKKTSDSRLVAEDEDLGEGYDEFVTDGGLALGAKAERDAARQHRALIAELIAAAAAEEEGKGPDGGSDSSEAEERAAYDAAQRRAGLDGLRRLGEDDLDAEASSDVVAIPRMRPLPDIAEVLQRMHGLLQGLEDDLAQSRARVVNMEKEKAEIVSREDEVQAILDQAGAKYRAVMGGNASVVDTSGPMRRPSPRPGIMSDVLERGLESFGATATKGLDADEAA